MFIPVHHTLSPLSSTTWMILSQIKFSFHYRYVSIIAEAISLSSRYPMYLPVSASASAIICTNGCSIRLQIQGFNSLFPVYGAVLAILSVMHIWRTYQTICTFRSIMLSFGSCVTIRYYLRPLIFTCSTFETFGFVRLLRLEGLHKCSSAFVDSEASRSKVD